MSADSSNGTLLQTNEGAIESQNERQGVLSVIRQHFHNLKQLKSFEIVISALKIFTSNPKFTLLVILSIIPLLVSMVFIEFKFQKSVLYASSNSFVQTQVVHVMKIYSKNSLNSTTTTSNTPTIKYYSGGFQVNKRKEFLSDALQLFGFYLFIYPILEFLSMIVTIKFTAKVQAADKQVTLREMLNQKVNFKGPSITYIYVHVLSNMALLGLCWVVTNYQIFAGKFNPNYYFYYPEPGMILLKALSIGVHLGIFLGLLYKYLDWSAFWNLGMVISVMEEQTGIAAFGLSDYYGKHCRKTGFQLMLVLFVLSNAPRVLCMCAALSDGSVAGVVSTSVVMMFFALGNLVKWVAFVLYYFYCKQQTMEKKVDDQELGQTVSANVP